jgi:hypothetical protein
MGIGFAATFSTKGNSAVIPVVQKAAKFESSNRARIICRRSIVRRYISWQHDYSCCFARTLADRDRDIAEVLDPASHNITGYDCTDACGGAGHNEIAGLHRHRLRQDRDDEARLLVARKRADLEMALRRRFDRAEKDGELPRGASPENPCAILFCDDPRSRIAGTAWRNQGAVGRRGRRGDGQIAGGAFELTGGLNRNGTSILLVEQNARLLDPSPLTATSWTRVASSFTARQRNSLTLPRSWKPISAIHRLRRAEHALIVVSISEREKAQDAADRVRTPFSLRTPQRNRNELGATTLNKTWRKHLARREKSIT